MTTETVIERDQKARGVLAKSRCIIAGLDIASEAFRQMDPAVAVTVHYGDGASCEPGTVVAEYRGYAAGMLTAERTPSTSCSGCLELPRSRASSSMPPRGASPFSTRARRPRCCARSKSAPCAGGGQIIAPASTMES